MYNDFYKGKKVFITGHTGFKGSWLCEILTLLGAKVCGYSLEAPTNPNLYKLLNLDEKIISVIGDIRDYDKLLDTMTDFEPDIVIHMAAQPIVRTSYKRPRYTYDVNVMGTVNVMEAIRHNPSVKSVVNVTTDKVYLNREWNYGYRECDELCGYDPYSNSKSCSELVTYSYKKSFFDGVEFPRVSTCRSGNVIGGGDFAKDRIMTDSISSYLNKEDIIIRNPYSIRPYQHVMDALNGYLTVAYMQYEDKKYASEYNFGPQDENCITTGNLVNLFVEKTGNKIKWCDKSDGGPHEANFLKLDISKATSVLNWHPVWNIDKTMDMIVEWLNAYENKKNITDVVDKQIMNFFRDKGE